MAKPSGTARGHRVGSPKGTEGLLRIGQLAHRVGLTNQMLHLYCSMGLLEEVRRTRSGYRLFGGDAVRRIELLRKLIRRGYSLREVKQTFRRGFGEKGTRED